MRSRSEDPVDHQETEVFRVGEGNPDYRFRIPSLVVTPGGTLLAFAEARNAAGFGGGGDHSENNIVLKRSLDGGSTWAPIQVVAEDGENSLNNPTAVVLRDTGRVILMYQRYPRGYHTSERTSGGHALAAVETGFEGDKICRTFVRASDDDGATWSDPEEVTRSIKRPETTATLCGPGIGIQLRRGPHRGRILMPFYDFPRPNRVYAVFSDDLGVTWSRGEYAENQGDSGGNENQMVELADGTVMINSRRSGSPEAPSRKVALSHDGGMTWSRLTPEPALPDQGCQGSLLRYTDPLDGLRSRLLFSNPASSKERIHGTVRLSYDEGKTWPVERLLRKEGLFLYSCLAGLPDGRIGCLYEYTPNKQTSVTIVLARFTLNWLSVGTDPDAAV